MDELLELMVHSHSKYSYFSDKADLIVPQDKDGLHIPGGKCLFGHR